MEWVETTGKSVEEAMESALDQLGVDEADAEFDVVNEAKTGLFGRVRTEARVRARVRPTAPRAKEAANNRRPRRGKKERTEKPGTAERAETSAPSKPKAEKPQSQEKATAGPKRKRPPRSRTRNTESTQEGATAVADEEVPLARQGELASEFLSGLLAEVQVPAAISVAIDEEEELVNLSVEGEQLGHLIGPRGTTLHSLQELTRTVVQRKTGARNGRILVDVAKYREKRREALERFTRQVAEEVISSGVQKVLDPMNPADRKTVHDAINDIDGVVTTSEGEEPRRRVVIKPAGSA